MPSHLTPDIGKDLKCSPILPTVWTWPLQTATVLGLLNITWGASSTETTSQFSKQCLLGCKILKRTCTTEIYSSWCSSGVKPQSFQGFHRIICQEKNNVAYFLKEEYENSTQPSVNSKGDTVCSKPLGYKGRPKEHTVLGSLSVIFEAHSAYLIAVFISVVAITGMSLWLLILSSDELQVILWCVCVCKRRKWGSASPTLD